MRKIRQVLRLRYEEGLSYRQIARSLGLSRDAARDYVTRAEVAGFSWPLPPDLDDSALEAQLFPTPPRRRKGQKPEPEWAAIHEAMKQKGATLQALHAEYRSEHPEGLAYSFFCERYRVFTKSLKRYMRQTYIAGERVFVDYAGPTVPIIDPKTGRRREAQIFVGVLGASVYTYCEAHWSQGLQHWIGAHARMFDFFAGVPSVVVCDGLKSAVSRASRSEPRLNPTYQDFAEHYGCTVIPARPYKPRDKSRAEGGVLLVERWILFRLRKRIFTSLADLNDALRVLLSELNERQFQKLPGSRREAFLRLDRPALRPLPGSPYEFAEFKKTRVGLDYHVQHEGHRYSVPYVLSRQEVLLRVTEHVVEILHGGRRVASHVRSAERGGVTTVATHMEPAHRHFGRWDASADLDWALRIGKHVHAFLQILLEKRRHREEGYRAGLVLKRLEREYGPDRLEGAYTRALEISATELASVRSILKSRLDGQPAQVGTLDEADFGHENIRGSDYYH